MCISIEIFENFSVKNFVDATNTSVNIFLNICVDNSTFCDDQLCENLKFSYLNLYMVSFYAFYRIWKDSCVHFSGEFFGSSVKTFVQTSTKTSVGISVEACV